MKKTSMSKTTVLAALAFLGAVTLVVTGWGTIAGNMGFKVDCTIQGPQVGVSLSGTNYIGLPYNQQLSLSTAKDLFIDIGGAVNLINQHRKVDDAFEIYTFGGGSIPPNGWALTESDCFIIKAVATQPYQIVGTHDPTYSVLLKGPGGGSLSGTNYYTHPYHGVAANAKELFQEIGGSIQVINQHRKVDDAFEIYTFGGGSIPPNGWVLNHNECYIVKVTADVPYVPQHY